MTDTSSRWMAWFTWLRSWLIARGSSLGGAGKVFGYDCLSIPSPDCPSIPHFDGGSPLTPSSLARTVVSLHMLGPGELFPRFLLGQTWLDRYDMQHGRFIISSTVVRFTSLRPGLKRGSREPLGGAGAAEPSHV